MKDRESNVFTLFVSSLGREGEEAGACHMGLAGGGVGPCPTLTSGDGMGGKG